MELTKPLSSVYASLATNLDQFAGAVGRIEGDSRAIAKDLKRLHRDVDGRSIAADDPRVVELRTRMSALAPELDAALEQLHPVHRLEHVSGPTAKGVAALRKLVHKLERTKDVDVHGLASSWGRVDNAIGAGNASWSAAQARYAVGLLTKADGTLREMDAAAMTQAADGFAALSKAWVQIGEQAAELGTLAYELVDKRAPGDYRDDVIYVADLRDKVQAPLREMHDAAAGASQLHIPGYEHATKVERRSAEIIEQLAETLAIVDTAIADGAHTVAADPITTALSFIRGHSSPTRSESPARTADFDGRQILAARDKALQAVDA